MKPGCQAIRAHHLSISGTFPLYFLARLSPRLFFPFSSCALEGTLCAPGMHSVALNSRCPRSLVAYGGRKMTPFHLRHSRWLNRPIVIYRNLFYRNPVHRLLNLMSISAISGKKQNLATNVCGASVQNLGNEHSFRKNTEILVSHRSWPCQLALSSALPRGCTETSKHDPAV